MVMCDDGGGRRIIEGERDMTFKAFSFWRGQVSSSFPPEAEGDTVTTVTVTPTAKSGKNWTFLEDTYLLQAVRTP
jgi:hypothetical protein